MEITKEDFKCDTDMATLFCSVYDEDAIVDLYHTCNFLGLKDLYKCLNMFVGSLYKNLNKDDIAQIYRTDNLPKSNSSNDPMIDKNMQNLMENEIRKIVPEKYHPKVN